ncbi:MAG: AAA-like domain protein (plasmid) [Spiroplasma endosymbiont of Drosophila atripex]|nr:MAG: AAA-like domain protein [Spiroplasma endosymbiont of Drosophila atripex]
MLVPDTWLGFLANLNNVNVNIKVHHISEQESLKLLDSAINRTEIQTTSKTSEEIKYQSYLEHFTELMNMVQNGGETLKMVSIIFTCFADTKKELDNIRTILIGEMTKKGFVPDELKFQQLKTYNFIWSNDIKNTNEWWQEMPVTSLASSYPFVATPLNDKQGLLLGTNDIDEPIIFDIKHRDSYRNSSNAFIVGMTGSGKTFNVKKQLNWLYCNNTKIYIIDPEREYHKLANQYSGQIIPIGKYDNARINPLEIFSDNLLEHISLLEQWFKILYYSLTDIDLSLLQQTLLKLYKNFKITDKIEFNKLTANDYPTLSDLFNLIEKQEMIIKTKSNLYNILWKLAKGADGHLWNGISTLSLKSDSIIFDTHELTSNKNRQNAQLFLMLSFLDKIVKQNKAKNETLPMSKQQWICIAIDEAHLLINENNNLALNFLFEMTKRIRKYNGILYIMTQNINDFMGNENIKTQAQGIINNCLYQFVHHLAASDLQDYDNLVSASGRLNEYQKSTIATSPTGTCLFSIGSNKRMILNIEASDIEQKTFS